MRYKILYILIFILIIGCNNIYSNSNDKKMLLVNIDTLILREKPTRDSKIITKLFKNRLLFILEETDVNEKINNIDSKWYKVRTINNITGYVFGGYLKEPVQLNSADDSSNINYGYNEQYEKIEADRMAKYSFVKRNGSDLIISLYNGKQKIISNLIPGPVDKEINVENHYFYGFINSINYAIIEVTYWESWGYTLVNLNNGEEIDIFNKDIIISPNKRNILVLTEFHKHFGGGGINILDISSGKPAMKFEKSFDLADYYPVEGVWNTDTLIKVVCKYKTNKVSFLFDVLLKYENNNWIIEE